MSPARKLTNAAASVRARLLEISRRRGVEFQLVLSEFAVERLLWRLGASTYSGRFVLKGATLFRLWSDSPHRATWDLDLLGRGSSAVADVVAVIRELCEIPGDDGIAFDAASLVGEEIRSADEYVGARVRFEARLAGARIPVQVDVGFGDAIEPAPSLQTYPTLLDHEAPRILAYPRETVVAEKLEDAPPDAEQLAEALRTFLLPVLAAAARDESFDSSWPAGGPWSRETGSGSPAVGFAGSE